MESSLRVYCHVLGGVCDQLACCGCRRLPTCAAFMPQIEAEHGKHPRPWEMYDGRDLHNTLLNHVTVPTIVTVQHTVCKQHVVWCVAAGE
jgi:hypothetical protein